MFGSFRAGDIASASPQCEYNQYNASTFFWSIFSQFALSIGYARYTLFIIAIGKDCSLRLSGDAYILAG
jgi:hypothetical protein